MSIDFYTIREKKYLDFLQHEQKVSFITFRYMLPFRLPLPSGDGFVINNTMFVPLHKEYKHYTHNDEFFSLPIKRTVIETTIKIHKKDRISAIKNNGNKVKRDKVISQEFNKQLETLNNFINIMIAKYKFTNIYPVHYGEIIGTVYNQLFKYNSKLITETPVNLLIILQLSSAKSNDEVTLQPQEIEEIMNKYYDYSKHEYNNVILAARKGERAYQLYDYNNSIVHYNSMFEVLMATFVRHYYEHMSNKSTDKINNIINNAGLKNLIDEHFNNILKKLKIKDYNEIKKCIDEYMREGYIYRNQIVHRGMNYGEIEAMRTREKMNDLSRLLNHNVRNAPKNEFVDFYRKFNKNSHHDDYKETIIKYQI